MIKLISTMSVGDTPLVETYRTLRNLYNTYVININVRSFVLPLLLVEKKGTSGVAANTAIALSKNKTKESSFGRW